MELVTVLSATGPEARKPALMFSVYLLAFVKRGKDYVLVKRSYE